MNALINILRRPTRFVLKQTDGPNRAIGAEVEPMLSAFGHIDEIASRHFRSLVASLPWHRGALPQRIGRSSNRALLSSSNQSGQ